MAGAILYAEPEAVFHTKFENAGGPEQMAMYQEMSEAGTHMLVAAIKASGSLFLASARGGRLVCASKNSMGSIYSDAGHYTLVRHFQLAHPAAWRAKYDRFVRFLQDNNLSVGCELVTGCFGDHAAHPATEHLVVTAVLDRRSLAPLSPLMLILLQEEFGLVIPGMFFFRSLAAFQEVYARFRWDVNAEFSSIASALAAQAWRVVDMPYVALHSENLEGLVVSWVPAAPLLSAAAATSAAPPTHSAPFDISSLREALLPPTPPLPPVGGGASPLPTERSEPLATLESLVAGAGGWAPGGKGKAAEAGVHASIRAELLRVLGEAAVGKDKVPLPLPRLEHLLAAAEAGDGGGGGGGGTGEGAAQFQALVAALREIRAPHRLSAFCNRGEWGGVGDTPGSDGESATPGGSVTPSEDLAERLKSHRVDGGSAVWGEGAGERGGAVGGAGLEAQVVVHVLQDSAFKAYASHRRRHPERLLPPLMRGYSWFLRFEPLSLPRKAPRAPPVEDAGGPAERQPVRDGAAARAIVEMLAGAPMPGSLWKFKLLAYTHRTFLIRNMGLALAKSGDLPAYRVQVSSWLDAWGAPVAVREQMLLLTNWWGATVVSMGSERRAALASGGYLTCYLRELAALCASTSASVGGAGEDVHVGASGIPFEPLHSRHLKAAGQGCIWLVVSCHLAARSAAARLAQDASSSGYQVPLIDARDLDPPSLRVHSQGLVVFGDVADPSTIKAMRLLHGLPTSTVASAILLLDVCAEGAALALTAKDPPVANDSSAGKRLLGMTTGFLKRLSETETNGADGPASLTVPRPASVCHAALLSAWLAGPGALACSVAGQTAAVSARAALRSPGSLTGPPPGLAAPPVYVVVFVTMPGWGKNVLCDHLAELDASAPGGHGVLRALGLRPSAAEETRGAEGLGGAAGREGGGAGMGRGWRALEGDVLGKDEFWKQAAASVKDAGVEVLVLNRNFPPNAWKIVQRLQVEASSAGRRLVPLPVIPSSASVGQNSNAVCLADMAVCLSAVQGRDAHPGKLDRTSRETCRVASLFFAFYQGVTAQALLGQARAFFQAIHPAARPVQVAWLRAGTEERLPASLQALLLRVASASSNSSPAAWEVLEEETRTAFHSCGDGGGGSTAPRFMARERLPPHEVARALLASLRQAIAGHEETVGPKLIHVLVPLDAVASLLASLRPLLPPDVAHRLDATLAGSKEYHVTLWHCNGNGHPPGVPEELVAMEGREVSLRVLALASDNVATAVKVEIVRDDEGTGSEVEDDGGSSRTATVPCFNLHPHITLWSLPGQAKHSNALLSGDGAAARRHLHAEAASSAREEEEGSASRLGASDRDPSLGDHGRGDECMGDGGGAAGCGGGGEAGLEEEEFHVDLSVVRGDGRDTLSMDLRGRVTRVEWA